MDDRVWYLAVSTLGAAVFVSLLDATFTTFETPTGFYPFLGLIFGFLGGVMGYKIRKVGAEEGDDGTPKG